MLTDLCKVVKISKSIYLAREPFAINVHKVNKDLQKNELPFIAMNSLEKNWGRLGNKILQYLCLLLVAAWVVPDLALGVTDCGDTVRPLTFYENVSLYALLAGFVFVILGILVDKKNLKMAAFGFALLPIAAWVYVQFFIDFSQIKRNVFAYDALAEGTLANIAEAQDRYKSEQGVFIKDLEKLYSHMAGSHGINPCVRILKINAGWDHWAAEAKHVSSPNAVLWTSKSGSSLKKG